MEDNIQKLAQLPEELIEKNIESWKYVVSRYDSFIKDNEPVNQGFLPVFELAKMIVASELAKLFRAGTSLYSLLISTAEKHGLRDGEPFVAIDAWRNKSPRILYYRGQVKVTESDPCETIEVLFESLQPFLERLWSETKGKDHA
jgi:hypothetical protein